jgi:integrase/recombinase XerC
MTNLFLDYLAYEKRLSKHTIIAYANDLRQFGIYLQTDYEITDTLRADYQMVRSWIVSLVEEKLSKRSVNRKIATLRSYYGFLVTRNAINKNPMLRIQSLKTEKDLPKYVEEKALEKLLDVMEFEEGFPGLRDRLVLELLYGTGIRLAELLGLKTSDIDHYNQQLKVLGKRNKERIIPMTNVLAKLVKEYLEERKNVFPEDDTLVTTDKGKAAYPMFIQRLIKEKLTSVTSLKQKSPHVLRHSFATHLLNNGAELNAIKDLLGHSSLSATQIYSHNSIDKLKRVFNQAHPKA